MRDSAGGRAWNVEATFLDPLPEDAVHITADPGEIGVNQLEAARTDNTHTAITIRTQQLRAARSHDRGKHSSIVWHYRKADEGFGAWKAKQLSGRIIRVDRQLPD